MGSCFARFVLVCATGSVVLAAPVTAMAGVGDSLVASGGEIVARFEGTDAGYDSQMALVVTSPAYSSGWIFPNHSTTNGATVSLGSFAAGTVLDFQLQVVNNGNVWHSGSASLNSDGVAHANVIYNWNGTGRTYVGWEDMSGGGDRDYNDHMFSFTNIAAVPEPETYAMMLAGFGLTGFVARRRKKKETTD
jgi:hypothetical protein